MLVVRVELHSAITGEVSTLATAVIDNVGGTKHRGDYRARVYKKGIWERFQSFLQPRPAWELVRTAKPLREGFVSNHPRLSQPVWSLVRKALESMNY